MSVFLGDILMKEKECLDMDDWNSWRRKEVSFKHATQLLGNAVMPPLIAIIGFQIAAVLDPAFTKDIDSDSILKELLSQANQKI